ncbi:MAG: transglycosylase domain-containing protein [Chloroflexota bacterium]
MRAQTVRWKIAHRHIYPRRPPHRLRWAMIIGLLSFVVLTSAGATAAGFYLAGHVPPLDRFHVRYSFEDARIYDSQGHLLYEMPDVAKNHGSRIVEPLQGRYVRGNACRGDIDRIPRDLQNATIATEDATFYTNPGFDLLSMARAAFQDLKYRRIVSGASTITQQVVRNAVLSDKKTIRRKAEEVALAYEVTKHYSKRQILTYYLNSVNYGNLAYGAAASARRYFHEKVCRLDFAQAALLAGLPEAPSYFDPVLHRSQALDRMRVVLASLRRHHFIHSKRVIRAAMREAQHWEFRAASPPMRYPAFVNYVISRLRHNPSLRPYLFKGIDVYTTLNPQLQNLAQQQVSQQINDLQTNHVTDGALVSLDLRPGHYGWIRAMVGSANYHDRAGQINMALRPRQPGSSMKPFNYIWAFTHGGVGPGTTIVDSPIDLPDPGNTLDGGRFVPVDYDHQWHGTVTLRQALDNSLNVPAVKLELYITGIKHVAATAYHFGMTDLYKDNPHLDCQVCWSLTLGGLSGGTRLLQETAAYGVFASRGRTVPPVALWKVVERGSRRVLYCSADCPHHHPVDFSRSLHPHRVLDPAHSYEMTNVLSDNNARCTPQVCEFGLTSPLELDRPAAAKTGTTNDWTDNWTVGYVPQLVTGVWTGNADRSPMVNVIGVTGAAPIWHNYMEGAFKILHLPVQPFHAPPQVTSTDQCRTGVSTFPSTGVLDISIRGQLPLCAVPERGYEPVTCTAPTAYSGWNCQLTGAPGIYQPPVLAPEVPGLGASPPVATPAPGIQAPPAAAVPTVAPEPATAVPPAAIAPAGPAAPPPPPAASRRGGASGSAGPPGIGGPNGPHISPLHPLPK